VLRATTEALARKLGNALVSLIIPFVPEGDVDPPSQANARKMVEHRVDEAIAALRKAMAAQK
jgi:hypothetical protein